MVFFEPVMIYSRSSQYAIRALTFLTAHSNGALCRLETIAGSEQIPQHFLAKILQRLVKKRLVKSSKGIKGGFALNLPAEKTTLFMIVDAIDDLSLALGDCILGRSNCSEETHCPLHESWKQLLENQVHLLQSITLADMASADQRRLHNSKEVSSLGGLER